MKENSRKKREKGLNIIIVGAGKVGATIVERLIGEGHEITVVDKNPDRIQAITNQFDVFGIVGNGATVTTQTDAGIANADMFIAVTASDELNLLCCMVAKKTGHCDVIARVRNPEYSEETEYLKEKLGLAMIINPDYEAAMTIARMLYIPTALRVNPFAGGLAEMVRIKLPQGNVLNGKQIMDLTRELSGAILICAVERKNQIYIPDGRFVLEEGDVVTFIAPTRDGHKFLDKIGFSSHQVRNTMIIGGGRTAYYLTRHLLDQGNSVKIIEMDKDRCEELSVLLPKAIVINGDGTNCEALQEFGVQNAEGVVALTSIDEENIILGLFANSISDAKVITKVNHGSFKNVINQLDLGSVVYPKYIASEAIVARVRSKMAAMDSNIERMLHLFDNRVEAIEFKVTEGSAVIGKPLYQLPLKDHLLITCINRQGSVIIPGGSDEIKAGDTVIIVTTHTGFNDVEDILQ